MAPGDLMVQMVFQDFFAGNKFMGRAQAGEVAGTSRDDPSTPTFIQVEQKSI